jgi:beta-glucosidase-like glycosyl hydrolase
MQALEVFMASFNEIDGVPATANKWLLTDVLRNQWGFNGFIVSDYTGVSEMIAHGIGDLQTVSARACRCRPGYGYGERRLINYIEEIC